MDRSNNTVNAFISLQGISKHFGNQTVVDRVSLDLPQGTFLSLLGPSGSGKTTILRMIAGLAMPDQGYINLKGKQINGLPPHKRNMGMVFQQYALFPHMTVAENVAYGLKARRMKKKEIQQKVDQYLKLVDLKQLAKRKPRELSGGQQQRVSLARALAVEPVVMLFDEPLSNLDVRLKEQMLREIRDLHRSLGFTAIYVTHDQKEALYLSDQIAVLNQGKIEQVDKPERILRQPASRFVADFLGFTNRLVDATYIGKQKVKVGDWIIKVGHQDDDLQPGDQGVILLRSNAIQIIDFQHIIDVKDHQKPISAQVVDGSYLGTETEVILRLADTNMKVTSHHPQMVYPFPDKGAKVKVWIDPVGACFFKGKAL